MSKVQIKNLPMIYPIPSVLVGTVIEGKANYNTLGNCGIISVDPAVIYISSHKSHYTNRGIKQNGVFSVNIPSTNQMKKLDYCGLVSGKETDKSKIFENYYKSNDLIPLIEECPINIECEVIKSFDVYEMEVFIGKVIGVYADQECLLNGYPDTKKVNPMSYCMDNLYYEIGKSIGTGFGEGRGL